MIHLSLLVRQLTGAVARRLIDNIGRLYLKIARLACLVKEKLYQCTLKARALAGVHRKSRSRYFDTQVKVYQAVFFARSQ